MYGERYFRGVKTVQAATARDNSAENSGIIGDIGEHIPALSTTTYPTVSTAVPDSFNSWSRRGQGSITAFFNIVRPSTEANRVANATHNCTTNTDHMEANREATTTTTTRVSPTNAPLTL